jgi:hypothetical protein
MNGNGKKGPLFAMFDKIRLCIGISGSWQYPNTHTHTHNVESD